MRPLRFFLRTALALLSVLCALLGGWSARAMQQKRVVAYVALRDGDVAYSYNRPAQPRPPAWMGKSWSRDFFFPVVRVGLREESQMTTDDLRVLRDLPKLRHLYLAGEQFNDESVEQIQLLRNLQVLVLQDTAISDLGLRRLSAHRRLEEIHLYNNATTVTGVEQLSRAMPQCKIVR